MNLTELSNLLSSATDVLRVETLDAYSSPSDADYLARFRAGEPKPDPAEKQPWLDRLAAAAERGHPWRRLRVVSRPVTEYVRYACEWGYVDNVAAGEGVRVLDEDSFNGDRVIPWKRVGDLYVVDGTPVFMDYDPEGRFLVASMSMPDQAEGIARAASLAWATAAPFAEWWSLNPDLHRDLTAV